MKHRARASQLHNVQPGKYGEPMLHHDFTQVILDALHMKAPALPPGGDRHVPRA